MRVHLLGARHNGPKCRSHLLAVHGLLSEITSILLTQHLQLLSLLHLLALLVDHFLVTLLFLVKLRHLDGQPSDALLDVGRVEQIVKCTVKHIDALDELRDVHVDVVVDRVKEHLLASIHLLERGQVAEARDVVVRVEEVGVELLCQQHSGQYEPIYSEHYD